MCTPSRPEQMGLVELKKAVSTSLLKHLNIARGPGVIGPEGRKSAQPGTGAESLSPYPGWLCILRTVLGPLSLITQVRAYGIEMNTL